MTSQHGKINFNQFKKACVNNKIKESINYISKDNISATSSFKEITIQDSLSGKRVDKLLAEKKTRSKKKTPFMNSDGNMKIDYYCIKKNLSEDSKPQTDIIYNNSYYNNLSKMNPAENDISMGYIQVVDEGSSTPSKDILSKNISSENIAVSSQSSVNRALSFSEQIPNYAEQLEQAQSFVNRVRSYIIDYSQEDVDDKFNLERNVVENEESLILSREANYFDKQRFIDVRMRVILVDWVMEVCSQLSFKRATFHSAVVLIDVFLSKMEDLKTNYLQLLGVTCLIIAAKNEEIVIPSFEAFSHSTDFAYAVKDILAYEKYVLNILNWRIHYPNLAFWSNYVSLNWDVFSKEYNEKYSHDFGLSNTIKLPRFRTSSNEEYFLFRNFFQIVDVLALDHTSLQYSEKCLCAATIYLLMGLFLKIFDIVKIVKEFTMDPSSYGAFYDLNMIFNRFLINFLNCEFDDLSDHITYVSFFFNLKFDYAPPVIPREECDEKKIIAFEEFLQIQTHNPYNIKSVEQIGVIRNSVLSVSYGNNN